MQIAMLFCFSGALFGWFAHWGVGYLVAWLLVSACAPEGWTRAGHLAAKILRKHARMLMVDSLISVPRAFLRIFHRDGPDSSHCSLLGLNSPLFGEVVVFVDTIICIAA
jgi:hypothetical protein